MPISATPPAPVSDPTTRAIASLALSEQRIDTARAAVQRALERNPDDSRALELLRLLGETP